MPSARLARGTVRHLVGLKRDSAQRVATRSRTWLFRATVYFESTSELGFRKSALASALERSSASANTPVAALNRDSRCSGLNELNEAKGDSRARCKISSPHPRPIPDTTC